VKFDQRLTVVFWFDCMCGHVPLQVPLVGVRRLFYCDFGKIYQATRLLQPACSLPALPQRSSSWVCLLLVTSTHSC
jgi:hypothetical protein